MPTAEIASTPAAPASETTENGKTTYPEWYKGICAEISVLPSAAGGKPPAGIPHAVLVRAAWMWPNEQVLSCAFVEPTGDSIQQAKVISVAKEWERYANIKLDFESCAENPMGALIRISFDPSLGSWSTVAKIALRPELKGKATMNLAWVDRLPNEAQAHERGVILHEFGHALGYLHEHQSPNRGEKLKLKEDVAIAYFAATQNPPWSEDDTRANFLNIYNKLEVSNYGSVDLTSIMMYFMPSQLNEQKKSIRPNNELSAHDKAFAFLNYPKFPGDPTTSDASVTLDKACETIGISGEFKENITAKFNAKDSQGMRAELTAWALDIQAEKIAREVEEKAKAKAAAQSDS